MKKSLSAISIALVLVFVVVVSTALAVLWGEPDSENTYSNVGFYLFMSEGGLYSCSGTLVKPDVFLTAGHCTADIDPVTKDWKKCVGHFREDFAFITFDQHKDELTCADIKANWLHGTAIAHPNYNGFENFPNTSDVGVVILDMPYYGVPLSEVAEPGFLDGIDFTLSPATKLFTIVGYGVQDFRLPFYQSDITRYYGTPKLVELDSANTGGYNIHFSSSPSKMHPGGSCFGDSGGPAYYQDKVTGVGSFVINQNCAGAGYYYRVDTQYAWEFLGQFLQD